MGHMQELFDRAVSGVIKQGEPSYDSTNQSCRYRGPCGTKCTIGHLITDEHYYRDLDTDINICDQGVQRALIASNPNLSTSFLIPSETFRMLYQLQLAHDTPAHRNPSSKQFIISFRKSSESIAKEFNLEWNHG